eukprot:2077308-Rhodomonas_salina.1
MDEVLNHLQVHPSPSSSNLRKGLHLQPKQIAYQIASGCPIHFGNCHGGESLLIVNHQNRLQYRNPIEQAAIECVSVVLLYCSGADRECRQ